MRIPTQNQIPVICSERVLSSLPIGLAEDLLREAIHRLTVIDYFEPISAEANSYFSLPEPIKIAVDMGRLVGLSGAVEIREVGLEESVTFARRIGKPRASRVVCGVEMPPTSLITIIVAPLFTLVEPNRKVFRSEYKLVVAYFGEAAEKEPWDPRIETDEEYERSLTYWRSHALIYGVCEMDEPFSRSWQSVLR